MMQLKKAIFMDKVFFVNNAHLYDTLTNIDTTQNHISPRLLTNGCTEHPRNGWKYDFIRFKASLVHDDLFA